MQVDCYKRNWHSSVCSPLCKFRHECTRAYEKEVKRKIIERIKNGDGSK